ncbi:MAG: sulfotransferase [Salibacteraceae bacterium]
MLADNTYPNLFLVGAPRCGTTTIVKFLEDFKEVFVPSVKEPMYLADELLRSQKIKRLVKVVDDGDEYIRMYASADPRQAYRVDASTSYLWTPGTAERIKKLSPDAKIIVVVREPVERAFSHYAHYVSRYGEKRSFSQFVSDGIKPNADSHDKHHVESGFYARNLARYHKVFSPDQILLLNYNDLKSDPKAFYQKITRFLGLGDSPEMEIITERKNASNLHRPGLASKIYNWRYRLYGGKIPIPGTFKKLFRDKLLYEKPDEPTARLLEDLYRDDMVEFERMTGIKFYI